MLTRRSLLQWSGAAAALGGAGALWAGPRQAGRARRLILVVAYGGWDTSYALDPKEPTQVDVPEGEVRRYGGLDVYTHASRPGVTELFERHAAVSAVVRGLSTDAINHAECMIRMATGTRQSDSPDLAAIVAYEHGRDLPAPYLMLGEIGYTGRYAAAAARVGAGNQLAGLLAHEAAAPSEVESAALERYAQASLARARALRGAHGANRRLIDDFESSLRRASALRRAGGFGTSGAVQSLDAQLELALLALERDLSQTVAVSTRLPWDTHAENERQGPMQSETFGAVARLLDELARRPGRATGSKMLDDTVVLCMSDLSRTPRFNSVGGKEHWPVMAALVAGAGVTGGQVHGATSADAQAMPIDLSTGQPSPGGIKPLYSHFVAGVLALCGVAPAPYLEVPPLTAFVA